jgi:hypothetical protein
MRLTSDRRWRLAAATAVLLVALSAAACSQDEDVGTSGGDEGDGGTEQVDAVEEDPTDVDDPTQFAFGQEVAIVDGDVEPRLLAADKDAPILIRNTTDAPVEIRFTNPGWDMANTTSTGSLAPGATFELDPIGVASITYELVGAEGVRGIIQVEEGLDEI